MKARPHLLAITSVLFLCGACLNHARAGSLSAMSTSLENFVTPIDLTAEGVNDWAYWGLNAVTDFDQKSGGTVQITNYILLGTRQALFYNNSSTLFSWTDGSPDASATGTSDGIYFPGVADGFEVDVAADTTPRLFNIYVGAWAAHVHFEAQLSDGSAPMYIDETLSHDASGGPNRRYSIIYAANSAGQTLKVKAWVLSTVDPNGNVTLQAATLGPVPPLGVTQPSVSPTNTVAAGTLVTMSVEAQGRFPYFYQWSVNGGSGYVPVPNSNTNTVFVNTTNLNGTYTYHVVVTNTSGQSVTSAPKGPQINTPVHSPI